jgi:hypothetical protein
MPQLKNPGWEAFARAHVAGCLAKGASAPWRLFYRAGVKARIAELVTRQATMREASLEETILALLDLASGTDQKTAAGAREARAARLEAHRLNGLLAARREAETWTPPREMTEAEWEAKYGPDAPGSRI